MDRSCSNLTIPAYAAAGAEKRDRRSTSCALTWNNVLVPYTPLSGVRKAIIVRPALSQIRTPTDPVFPLSAAARSLGRRGRGADHIEAVLIHSIEVAAQNRLAACEGVLQGNTLTRLAGERFGG